MKKNKFLSVLLCAVILMTMMIPAMNSFSASITLEITKDGEVVVDKLYVKEYNSVQLDYTLSETMPEGAYIEWESSLPLLAGVNESGKVTGYDYSKAAIFRKWLDEEIRSTPLVGDALADSIVSALESAGIDIETADTNAIVTVVRTVAGDALADSLKNMLDNMTVEIFAKLYDSNGTVLAEDKVEVVVEKSIIASVAPTGVHITNKKKVPTTVAVGTTVQLYGACTPVRIKQDVAWSMDGSSSSSKASVSDTGLVTFNAPGQATVKLNPKNAAYKLLFSDKITFNIVDPSELPVTDFEITGATKVDEGKTIQLAISNLIPAGAYTGDLVWSSSDPAVAIVDQNGVVTGLDGGSGLTYSKTATITATIGGVTKSFTVTVSRNLIGSTISGVEISGDSAVGIGNSTVYSATITPSRLNSNSDVIRRWGLVDPVTGDKIYASDSEVTDGIGKIDNNGNFTGVLSGKSKIFIDAEYKGTVVSNTFEVTVGNAITDFTISGTDSIKEGDSTTLTITSVTPADYDPALLDTIVWTSADPSIASVDSNGVVKGLDAGGNYSIINNPSKTTTITATIGGVSKTFTVKVSAKPGLNKYTGGKINGPDAVVVDFPYTFTSTHTPERMGVHTQFWGTPDADGNRPWDDNDKRVSSVNDTNNNHISVNASTGTVTGLQAGSAELWTYMTNNALHSSRQTLKKYISVVELTPKSISVTAPAKYEYLEGETELDLTGLEIKLTYDKNELAQHYPEASGWSDDKLTVPVTNYTVSAINPDLLDSEQYIIVTVTRAGKEMRAIFPILVKSKQVDTVEITQAPKYQYIEGENSLDLTGLKVVAHYLNAPSEEITNYTVNTSDFDPTLLNVEQNITVNYSHCGRSASATFPVIIYGIPVVSVSTEPADYSGDWTKDDVTFVLDSTHQIDGITYYYKASSDSGWTALTGNRLTVSTNIEDTYYFKAINGKNIDGAQTIGYKVRIDKVVPQFSLVPAITDITNQSYTVNINVGTVGASGVAKILLNGTDISGNTQFTVDENGDYTVKIITAGGTEKEELIKIENIDKIAPEITDISIAHKNTGGFARFINTITFGKFFNKTAEATITAQDTGVAGVDFIEYRYLDENGNPITSWAVYNESNKPSQDPDFKGYIEARVTDKATNVSETYYSEGYVIDGTNPTDIVVSATDADGLYVNDTWTSTDVTLTLSSTAFSDIYMYYYSTDGGVTWNELSGNTLVASTHGVTEYQFKAESYSALESSVSTFTVKIDKIKPVIRVNFEGTFGRWTSGDVKFDFSLLENAVSGIKYYYTTDGTSWSEITTGSEILLNENTNATYIFKAVNGAGIESDPSDSYKVMIDNVAPSVTFNPEITAITTEPYNVGFSISAGASGLKSVSVNGVDVTGQDKITVSENGNYVFVMTGNNGITTTEVLRIENFISYEIKIADIKFTSEKGFANHLSESFGKYFGDEVTVSIEASCNDGTIGKIEYRFLDENGNPTSDWNVYNGSDKPTVNSNFKGSAEARAFNGNGTKVSESVISEGITVDLIVPTVPTVNATVNGEIYQGDWTDKQIDITLSSDAFSGIYEYFYRISGGEWIKLGGNTVSLKDVGENSYEFKAVSKSGLESDVATLSTKYENAIPALSVSVDGTIGHRTYDDVTFTLASPNTLSGIKYYYNTGTGWTEMTDNTLTVNSTADATYIFKAVNGAGVESYQSPSYRVIVDKHYLLVEKKPILNVSVSGTTDNWSANSTVFSLSATECEGDATFWFDNGNGWQEIAGSTLAVTKSGAGTYKFKAVDSTGRESTVSAEYSVMIDTVSPNISVNLDSTNFTNSARLATVNASAGISGLKSVTVNGADITESGEFTVTENGKYTVTVTANNGLSATTILSVASFDYDAPNITDIILQHKNTGGFAKFINAVTFGLFFNEEIEISVTANDTGASGLDRIEYRLLDENMSPVTEWAAYNDSDKPTVNADFKGFAEARAVDKAGNTSPVFTSRGFVIDADKPANIQVIATVDGNEYNGAYTAKDIILKPNATAFSDIGSYMYCIDNGEWNVMTTDSVIAVDGVHTYTFKAVSNANIESDTVAIVTKTEKNAPEITVNTVGTIGAWTSAEIVFTLNASNCNSGVKYYFNNGNGWQEMSSNVLTVCESVNATYKFKAVNGVGSESNISDEYAVMFDKASPSLTLEANTEKFTNKDVEVKIDITDNSICGISNITLNGETYNEDKFTVSENGTYIVTVTLNNGNKVSETVTVSNIDKDLPSINKIDMGKADGEIDGMLIFGKETELTIHANDNGVSGIKEVEYRAVNTDSLLAKMGIDGFWKKYDENDKPILKDDFTGYVEVKVTDNAGNVFTASSENILVDAKVPELTLDTDYEEKWTNQDVEILLNAEADSGIAYYMIKTDNGEWAKLDGNKFTASEDGIHTYSFKAVSNSGLESEKATVKTFVEKGSPEISVNAIGTTDEWTSEDIVFVLDSTNTNSGVTYYCNNGKDWNKLDSNVLTVNKNTEATYTFKAVNGTGSESAVSEKFVVMIDKSAPENFIVEALVNGKPVKNGETLATGVTVTLSADAASDIEKYQYSINGGEWTDLDSDTFTADKEGLNTYAFRAVSSAGVVSEVKQISFNYDKDYVPGSENSGSHGNNNVQTPDKNTVTTPQQPNTDNKPSEQQTTENAVSTTENNNIAANGQNTDGNNSNSKVITVVSVSLIPIVIAAAIVIIGRKKKKED